jgi:hypothetical protein
MDLRHKKNFCFAKKKRPEKSLVGPDEVEEAERLASRVVASLRDALRWIIMNLLILFYRGDK